MSKCSLLSVRLLGLLEIMSRVAPVLVVALVLLSHAAGIRGGTTDLDSATHHAAPPAANNWIGWDEVLAGLDVYVSGYPSASAAVIMISDVFGWKTPLFRKLADKIAASGYYVVAPDYFRGDPLVNVSDVATWLIKHPPAPEVATTKMVVEALGAKGFESVGLAGFCWGAKVAVLTGKEKFGHVNAIVQSHPAFAEESDYAEVALPISVLASPEDGIEKFKGLLKMRKKEEHLKVYVKIFKGVMHGWTIRYDENDKKAVAKANQAHRRLLVWFHKYLH